MKYFQADNPFFNSKDTTIPIVLDDIVFSLANSGGGSGYWYEIIRALTEDSNFSVSIIDREDNSENMYRKKLDIEQQIHQEKTRLYKHIDRFLDLKGDFPSITLFHSSHYRIMRGKNCVNVVTVLDFTFYFKFSGLMKWIHVWQQKHAIRQAEAVICISESTKQDVLEVMPEAASKQLYVTYLGYDEKSYQYRDIKRKQQVVYIGARRYYKNFKLAVEAVSTQGDIDLIIIGKPLAKDEIRFLEDKVPDRYYMNEYPSNPEVCSIFNESIALLYVSDYEGFGIPILEAMASGLPVIALNKSSIPEVAGNAGILLDDGNPKAIASAINQLIDDQEYFDSVVTKGLKQATLFSWKKCMDETKRIYKETYLKALKK